MTRAAAAAILVAGVAFAVLAGRGSDSSAQAAVRRAAASALDAKSSRFIVTVSSGADATEATINGVMDYVHHRGTVTVAGWDTGASVMYDGDAVYMKWPVPWRDSAPWVRLPRGSDGDDVLYLQDRAMHNPIGMLEFLSGASRDTREVGSDVVRGTATTHYEGTLDLQLVVDQAPPERRPELQSSLDFIAEDLPTKVPFGLWVDADLVTHRLRIGGADESETIDYFDFGVPVEITPPQETVGAEAFFDELAEHADDQSCGDDTGGEAEPLEPDDADAETDAGEVTVELCVQAAHIE